MGGKSRWGIEPVSWVKAVNSCGDVDPNVLSTGTGILRLTLEDTDSWQVRFRSSMPKVQSAAH